jgi:hypothetical protein
MWLIPPRQPGSDARVTRFGIYSETKPVGFTDEFNVRDKVENQR